MYLTKIGATLLLVFTFYACSSDPEEMVSEIEPPQEVVVTGYEQEYAYLNDIVSLKGENFITDLNAIDIKLDGVAVELISASVSKIEFRIPKGTSSLPNLTLTMTNTNISYANEYMNIAIVDNSKGKWISYDYLYTAINEIRNLDAIGEEGIYFSLEEKDVDGSGKGIFRVYETTNGGVLTRPFYPEFGFRDALGGFLLGKQNGIFTIGSNIFNYQKADGTLKTFDGMPNMNNWPFGLYADDNEEVIFIGCSEGRVYKSSDNGTTFDLVHENASPKYEYTTFYAHSSTQVWLAGYTFPFPENRDYYPAKLLMLKEDGNWYDTSLEIENVDGNLERIQLIKFIDGITGFASAYIINSLTLEEKYVLLKTTNKGDTWDIVLEHNQKIEDFTFKDVNEGWYISGKEIYHTTNGGSTWNLIHTNDTSCKGILYTPQKLWVLADRKLLKYYF